MPRKDRSWFERKVRELGDVLRRLPPSRRALVDAALEGVDEAVPVKAPEGGLTAPSAKVPGAGKTPKVE